MTSNERSRALMAFGSLLFFFGLIFGLLVPAVRNPRMGLASHLEGVTNGTFLIAVGAIWSRVRLSPRQLEVTFWLLLWGTYVNALCIFLGGVFGTSRSTPIAGAGFEGAAWQEQLINAGLTTVVIAMLVGCGLLTWGLFRRAEA